MSRVNPPTAGENVLKWARDITREVNSLQPTAGPGQKVSKTTAGTTYAVDGSAMAVPDSLPKVAALISSYTEKAIVGSNTTYSLERNRQNSLALFGFSDLFATKYKKRELSDVHFVVRDTGTEKAVLSAPTVRYMDVNDFVFGPEDPEDPDDPKDPNWPGLSNILSVCPDSEMFWPGSIVSKSIYHNSKGGLAIYHFEELSNSDLVDTGGSLADLHLVTRDATKFNNVPTVRYTPLSALSAVPDSELLDDNLVSQSIQHNSKNGLALYHFEDMSASDVIDQLNEDEDYVLVRHKSGNNPPVLKYTNKLSGGGGYPISGLTEDIPVLLSVAYSTTTHQFTQTSRLLHFSNGLLISADNAVETTVFEAVEEQV